MRQASACVCRKGIDERDSVIADGSQHREGISVGVALESKVRPRRQCGDGGHQELDLRSLAAGIHLAQRGAHPIPQRAGRVEACQVVRPDRLVCRVVPTLVDPGLLSPKLVRFSLEEGIANVPHHEAAVVPVSEVDRATDVEQLDVVQHIVQDHEIGLERDHDLLQPSHLVERVGARDREREHLEGRVGEFLVQHELQTSRKTVVVGKCHTEGLGVAENRDADALRRLGRNRPVGDASSEAQLVDVYLDSLPGRPALPRHHAAGVLPAIDHAEQVGVDRIFQDQWRDDLGRGGGSDQHEEHPGRQPSTSTRRHGRRVLHQPRAIRFSTRVSRRSS